MSSCTSVQSIFTHTTRPCPDTVRETDAPKLDYSSAELKSEVCALPCSSSNASINEFSMLIAMTLDDFPCMSRRLPACRHQCEGQRVTRMTRRYQSFAAPHAALQTTAREPSATTDPSLRSSSRPSQLVRNAHCLRPTRRLCREYPRNATSVPN